jgi:16S rRNA processing protein RimM
MEKELVPIGRVTKLHGVRGKIKVDYFGERSGQVPFYREVWIKEKPGRPKAYEILEVTPQPARLILQLKGVQNVDEALPLIGKEIYIRKESLPELPEDEFYWVEMIGMEVETEWGTRLGRIKEILPTGPHDVYVVQGKRKEVLLPAVESVIQGIDRQKRIVRVAWMEGLWEKEDEV